MTTPGEAAFDRLLVLYERLKQAGYTKLSSRYNGRTMWVASLTGRPEMAGQTDLSYSEHPDPSDNAFVVALYDHVPAYWVRVVRRLPSERQDRLVVAVDDNGGIADVDPDVVERALDEFLTRQGV